jgi:hypothetical protein
MPTVRNLTHGQLTIKDGSTTPKTLVVPFEMGNLEFTVTRSAFVFRNRGTIAGMTPGLEEPCQVNFGLKFSEWLGLTTSGAAPSVVDTLYQQGNASTWVSTLGCGPYTVDLEFLLDDPCAGTPSAGENETLTFADFHADEVRFVEGEEFDELTVSGKCAVLQPTSVRV